MTLEQTIARNKQLDLLTYHTLGAFEGLVGMIDCIPDEQLKRNLRSVKAEYDRQRAEIEKRYGLGASSGAGSDVDPTGT